MMRDRYPTTYRAIGKGKIEVNDDDAMNAIYVEIAMLFVVLCFFCCSRYENDQNYVLHLNRSPT